MSRWRHTLVDGEGVFVTLSPAEAQAVMTRLVAAQVAFTEDPDAALGCAGPEVVVLRFDGPRDAVEAAIKAAMTGALGA